VAPLAALDFDALRAMVGGMEAEGLGMLAEAGVPAAAATSRVIGAMRYAGQGFQVEAQIAADALASGNRDALRAAFERQYLQQYGRTEPALPVECVSWQVIMAGPVPSVATAAPSPVAAASAARSRPAYFPDAGGFIDTPVIDRATLRPGDRVSGPALIEERESTLVLPTRTEAVVDASLNLVVTVQAL
jgi:N-methylhydantoinase A